MWRYTFDDGPEKPLEASSLYSVAAMAAFAKEDIQRIPQSDGHFLSTYDGHVLVLWDDQLRDLYGVTYYGLAWNECGSLTILPLHKRVDLKTES